MINLRVRKIITVLLLSILILTFAIGLTACDKLEDREDYIEENGWIALITSEEYKTAKLIGNKEESVINGEAFIPSFVKNYKITHIRSNYGYAEAATDFKYLSNKLFIPGNNYSFSRKNLPFPSANKFIFLDFSIEAYSNGFINESSFSNVNNYYYPYSNRISDFIVPKASLNDFRVKYSKCTRGGFKAANISYFYNYVDSPNGGYCWIDDLDAGDSIKTIPMAPQREGYGFGGWFLDEECITPFSFDSFIMTENGELNLYAKWIQL